MNELKPIAGDDTREVENKAVVVFKFGKGIAMCVDLNSELRQVADFNAGDEVFSLENVDHEPQPDGIYIGEFRHVDDGPSDWDNGSRETILGMHNFRPITEKEWSDCLDGLYPWGASGEDEL